MNKTVQLILLFAITFLIGGTGGYFLRGSLPAPSETQRVREERVRWREMSPEQRDQLNSRMRDRMISDMQLQEEQHEIFFTLVNQHRREMRRILEESRRDADRDVRAQADSLYAQLAVVLDAEQLEHWQKLQRRMIQEQGQGPSPGRTRD